MKNESRVSIYKTIFFLIIPYLFVDSVNGLLLREGYFSISIICKLIILALILLYLRKRALILFVGGVMLIYLSIHTLILGDPVAAAKGLIFLFKFLAIVIFYVFFTQVVRNGNQNWIIALAVASFTILAINLILGALGYGYPQYDAGGGAGIGSRGFIFAGNELAGALVVSSALIMMQFIVNGHRRAFLIFAVVVVAMSALATSKVTMLSSLILFLAFPIMDGINRKSRGTLKRKDKRFLLLVAVAVPLVGLAGISYALFEMNLYSRLVHYYSQMDLLTVILSQRNIWAEQALKAFGFQYSFLQWLFGSSRQWWTYISGTKIVEIDFIDILMTYGIAGVVIVYGFFVAVLGRVLRVRKRNPYALYIAFTLLLMIGISVTAGHVVYSGIIGPLLGALAALGSLETNGSSDDKTRLLLISNMYPTKDQPCYGIFVGNFAESMTDRDMGITKAVIRGRGRSVAGKLFKYARFVFGVYLRVFREKYDLLYVHYATHSLLPLIPVLPFIDKPLVVNFHGSDLFPSGFAGKRTIGLNSSGIRRAAMLVVPSDYFRAKVSEKYNHPNIYVSCSGGVDLSLFTPEESMARYDKQLTVGYVSRIDQGKGWGVLLNALHVVKNNEPELAFKAIIVGGGEQVDSMESMIIDLGLAADVSYIGPVRQTELPAVYRRLDVFVFPTVRAAESLGLVGLEAMACGVPVIGSNTGGLTGYIRHGENGFLFEPGNFQELADRIVMFCNLTRSERIALSQQAIRTARTYDSIGAYDGLAKVIRKVASE